MTPKSIIPKEIDMKEKASQVFFLNADLGLTVAEACEEVGITQRQYYYWIRKAGDIIGHLRKFARELWAEELVKILSARSAILDNVIRDGLSEFTSAADRLLILQHLETREPVLTGRLTPADSQALSEVLGMPELVPGESRLIPGEGGDLEITKLDDGIKVSPKRPVVIDVTPED